MKVRDMMHKGVACVSPDTAIDAVAKKCASSMSAPFRSPPMAISSA